MLFSEDPDVKHLVVDPHLLCDTLNLLMGGEVNTAVSSVSSASIGNKASKEGRQLSKFKAKESSR
jgi:hypothetical protein